MPYPLCCYPTFVSWLTNVLYQRPWSWRRVVVMYWRSEIMISLDFKMNTFCKIVTFSLSEVTSQQWTLLLKLHLVCCLLSEPLRLCRCLTCFLSSFSLLVEAIFNRGQIIQWGLSVKFIKLSYSFIHMHRKRKYGNTLFWSKKKKKKVYRGAKKYNKVWLLHTRAVMVQICTN